MSGIGVVTEVGTEAGTEDGGGIAAAAVPHLVDIVEKSIITEEISEILIQNSTT